MFNSNLAPEPAKDNWPAPPPKREQPGGFTDMFQQPRSPVTEEPKEPEGEFSQFFKNAPSGPLPPSTPPRNPAGFPAFGPPQVAPPASQPGGYTQLFTTGPAAPQPSAEPAGSGATGVFSTPTGPAAPSAAGPSEYTRMMARPSNLGGGGGAPGTPKAAAGGGMPGFGMPAMPQVPGAPAMPAAPKPPAPPAVPQMPAAPAVPQVKAPAVKPAASNTLLLILLGVLIFLAGGLAVFLILRH